MTAGKFNWCFAIVLATGLGQLFSITPVPDVDAADSVTPVTMADRDLGMCGDVGRIFIHGFENGVPMEISAPDNPAHVGTSTVDVAGSAGDPNVEVNVDGIAMVNVPAK